MKFNWIGALLLAALASACGNEKPPAAVAPDAPVAQAAPAGGEMFAAMMAAFPEADPTTGIVQHATASGPMPEIEKPLVWKLRADGASWLVTARETPDGGHVTTAKLSAFYLSGGKGAYKVEASYPNFTETGSWGAAGDTAAIELASGREAFVDYGGFANMGCAESVATVFLFDAGGPVKALDRAPLAKEYAEGGIDVDGVIVLPPPAGADFAIRYTGKAGEDAKATVDATVTWSLAGNTLAQTSGAIPETVADGC